MINKAQVNKQDEARHKWTALSELRWFEATQDDVMRGLPITTMLDGKMMVLKQKYIHMGKDGESEEMWLHVKVEEKS